MKNSLSAALPVAAALAGAVIGFALAPHGGMPVLAAIGVLLGGICLFLHMQARRLAAEVSSLQEDMERTRKAMAHFNHALRTPITTVSGITELMEMAQNQDENGRKLVKTLRSATNSLRDLADSIPDISGKNQAQKERA